jgi:hypothetical protein
MQAIANAKRLDWSGWSLGIMRSYIAGGAGAVAATTTVGFADPKDWGPGNVGHMMLLFAITFFGTGLMHMMVFLETHPTPDAIVVAEVETKTTVTPTDHAVPPTETTSKTQVLGPVPVETKEKL